MKKLTFLAATTAALALAGAAQATTFLGDYTITTINSSDPGLVVQTYDLPGAINLNLAAPGATQSVDLFKIWTNESSVNAGEDTLAKAISVLFSFTVPSAFGGSVDGDTYGYYALKGLVQSGHVAWDGPTDLHFGSGGVLRVTLNDADFNKGILSLDEGKRDGATITADFKLISNAVPEPATWAMMIAGFGLVGATLRRRREGGVAA